MMKKSMLLVLLSTIVTAVACGGNAETSNPKDDSATNTGTGAAVAVRATLSASVSEDMADYASFTVSYYDEGGTLVSEDLTGTLWTKVITVNFPAVIGVRLKGTLSTSKNPQEKDVFNVIRGKSFKLEFLDDKGNVVNTEIDASPSSSQMAGNRVAEWFAKYAGVGIINWMISFAADGTRTNGQVSDE